MFYLIILGFLFCPHTALALVGLATSPAACATWANTSGRLVV